MKRCDHGAKKNLSPRDRSGCVLGVDRVSLVVGNEANMLGLGKRAPNLLRDESGLNDVLAEG
jgi:hypothetical protein